VIPLPPGAARLTFAVIPAGRDLEIQVTIAGRFTSYRIPGGTGIRARCKGMWLGLLLATSVVVFAAGRPDDSKGDKGGDDEPVYTLTDDVTPPRVTKQVNPQYSPGSRGVRIHGSVLIETIVSSRGDPKKTHVVRSLDKEIDAAAVDAVNQWLFQPGKKNGKPVAVRVQIEIQFHSM